ncbi:TetR/AcrR family transcriptional regulator [Kitasatospora purpeofusca]|uniref:TetR/AcrR family transcriptional regulator n=1 Tax=Kitasatospora purpeofusca TaxID=67352 RepID=UPI002A5AA8D1|nr:TetR/AcrR family transcriptional regulator [Kitasatospora purpeofusca]MDY0813133.1 TetR/AcrR family transcriptional regulator [Kitasatospora purpeofusca]
MDTDAARTRILDAAEELFYAQGVQTVGMDAVRTAAGVTLRRLYQLFPSKDDLVEGYLDRRDRRWLADLADHVDAAAGTPGERVLAVYDWLADWFFRPGFRGCAFVNSYGELGATAPGVAAAARRHKEALRDYLTGLADEAGGPAGTGVRLALLAEGAITLAALTRTPAPAAEAREVARLLLANSSTGVGTNDGTGTGANAGARV